MASYTFTITGPEQVASRVTEECSDDADARVAALHNLGDFLLDNAEELLPGAELAMEVTGPNGGRICRLQLKTT